MGSKKDGAAAGEVLQECKDRLFRSFVKTGSDFIQEQDRGIAQDGSCKSQTVPLPIAQSHASVSQQCVEAFGKG